MRHRCSRSTVAEGCAVTAGEAVDDGEGRDCAGSDDQCVDQVIELRVPREMAVQHRG